MASSDGREATESGAPGAPHIPGVEVWRGGVNTWECDEMGHMNVRFYVARCQEALVGMAAALGMPHAFKSGAGATLLVTEQHIRFLKEAHAGAPLHMMGAVLGWERDTARLLFTLVHSDSGLPAASFQTVVAHVTAQEGRPFPWTGTAAAKAEALAAPLPPYAASRSVGVEPVTPRASLAEADRMGLIRIAVGAVTPADCDAFGRMRLEGFIGRVSDGIPRLVRSLRTTVAAQAADRPARVGGAVLEYRLLHLGWPRCGDRLEVRSGLAGVDSRTQRLVHWMLDPETGRAFGSAEAVAVTFDLDARKVVPISEAAQAAVQPLITPGLML